jgi:E3 ubiquitin-protein ligase HUWE1
MQLEQANEHFRSLVTLHIRITLLSDVCQVAGYPQSRSVNLVLQTLTASDVDGLIPALGALHRHSIWEHLNLSRQLNAKGLGNLGQPSTEQSAALQERSPSDSPVDVFGAPPQVSAGQTNAAAPPENATDAIEDDSVKQNAKALMHVASELPKTLKNFFTGNQSSTPLRW